MFRELAKVSQVRNTVQWILNTPFFKRNFESQIREELLRKLEFPGWYEKDFQLTSLSATAEDLPELGIILAEVNKTNIWLKCEAL